MADTKCPFELSGIASWMPDYEQEEQRSSYLFLTTTEKPEYNSSKSVHSGLSSNGCKWSGPTSPNSTCVDFMALSMFVDWVAKDSTATWSETHDGRNVIVRHSFSGLGMDSHAYWKSCDWNYVVGHSQKSQYSIRQTHSCSCVHLPTGQRPQGLEQGTQGLHRWKRNCVYSPGYRKAHLSPIKHMWEMPENCLRKTSRKHARNAGIPSAWMDSCRTKCGADVGEVHVEQMWSFRHQYHTKH